MAATTADQAMFSAGMGRAFATGAALGFVGAFALYTGVAVAAGAELRSSLGIGLFAAFWGGIGFGGMFGAVLGASAEPAPAPAASPARPADAPVVASAPDAGRAASPEDGAASPAAGDGRRAA